ncbi:UNVERIFIED_CONTAM: hypothetical protein Sradi_5751100 [Sesamum radiatum]|uniref:Uncharacterized protein n=1 Tax=Sesamum radiatum TaxID=300843 RepID=A0AAW2L3T4_SESRA
MKRVMEFCQGVKREVPLLQRGIPFSADIMAKERSSLFILDALALARLQWHRRSS